MLSNTNNNMSLYIPRVFANISEEKIRSTFDKLGLGVVDRVDIVSKMGQHGEVYNSVYVHFDYWYSNAAAFNFQERLKNPAKQTRVVYDDPWFWIVLENKSRKFVPGERKQRININISDNLSTSAVMETPKMSYRDAATCCGTPVKNQNHDETMSISEDEFDEVCRRLEFDEVAYEADMMETGRSWSHMDMSADADDADDADEETIEDDFVPEENFDLVDADYVAQLEHVNRMLMDENMCLKSEITYIRSFNTKYELYNGYAY